MKFTKIAILVIILSLLISGVSVYAQSEPSFPEPITSLYELELPYYAQKMTAKMWNGDTDPTFAEVIQHLSRSVNDVWPEDSAWDGDNSEVDLSAFINSEWGEQTARNWYPYISTVFSPDPDEAQDVYWPRVSMNPDLVEYWQSVGLTKVYYPGADADITDDYYVYYPNGADEDVDGSYPLIILFHGGGEAALQAESFGFGPIAVRDGLFLMAAESFSTDEDRVGAIDTYLSEVLANYPMIDQSRIYAVGSSMGGSSAQLYANTHTTTVAAAGVMDQPVSLNTIANNPASEQQIADIQANGMPEVYVGGLADMYGLYNISTKDYFYSHEGSSPNDINDWWPDYVTGFNMLMEAYNITGKDIVDIAARQAIADTPDVLEVTTLTGYPFDNSEVDASYGVKVYKSTFEGQDRLLSIIVENRPHMPSGYDAELIWDFISQWQRDLETGQSVSLQSNAPTLSVSSDIFGTTFTNGKSTLKYALGEVVEFDPSTSAVMTLAMPDGSPIDDSKIDASGAYVALAEGDGYYPSEYIFEATELDGDWVNGTLSYSIATGDFELNTNVYPTEDKNSGREWSCLGGDGQGNYYYNLEVGGILYDGEPVAAQTFRVHVYVYGYNYSSDAETLYGAEGTQPMSPVFASLSEKDAAPEASDAPVWTWVGAGEKPILSDALVDDFYITWPAGTDASAISASDVTITLYSAYGDTKELSPNVDFQVNSAEEETQIALLYQNWAFIPVYSTMTIEVNDITESFDIASVYVYEAQQGGGGVKQDGTVTAFSFYGLANLESWEQILAPAIYVLATDVDGTEMYYAEDESGNGILTEDATTAIQFDASGVDERNQTVIGNTAYVTLRVSTEAVEMEVGDETIAFQKLYPGRNFPISGGGGLLSPTDADPELEALPGYVIPWGTSNWITNEKWAWQSSLNMGWVGITVTPYEGKFEWSVEKGQSEQFTPEYANPDELTWSLAGDVSEGTTVSSTGLLTVDANETIPSFTVVVTSLEGEKGAVTINVP